MPKTVKYALFGSKQGFLLKTSEILLLADSLHKKIKISKTFEKVKKVGIRIE